MNELISVEQLRALPKVELHRHLDCSMRFSTLTQLAQSLGIKMEPSLEKQRDQFLILSPMKDLETVLKKFTLSRQVLNSTAILERLAFETIEDAFNENIRVLELRYSLDYITEGHPNLSFEDIHSAFTRGADKALIKYPMAVGFIAIIQRSKSLKNAEKILEFVCSHRNSFIGLDLADVEINNPPEKFELVFQKAFKLGIPFSVHAGESPFQDAARNVIRSIQMGARRIGHGLQIINDKNALDLVVQEKIPLELCPTSNYLTQSATKLESHPLRELFLRGVRTTINTDDPGIFNITLTDEYQVAANLLKMTKEDLIRCNQYAFEASFIDEKIKNKFWQT